MVEVLHQLCRDHVHLRGLLDLIDQESQKSRVGAPADSGLLHAISEFILHYPGMVHEPKEVLIYTRLVERNPSAAQDLEDWAGEHQHLAALSKRFSVAVFHGRRDMGLPSGWWRHIADEFVQAYRRHIDLEELTFFPVALRHLTMDDWLTIDAAVTMPDHPVFGTALQESFAVLRREIALFAKNAGQSHPMR